MKHIPNKQALGAADNLEAFGFQPDDPGVEREDLSGVEPFNLGFVIAIILAIAAGFCLLMWSTGAKAQHIHHAQSNPKHFYDYDCCHLNDCAPIAANAVSETPKGYAVSIRPGTHPMWKMTRADVLRVVYPYRSPKVRPSKDGEWHVCINGAGDPLCLYVIGGGF